MADIGAWTYEHKLGETLTRALPKLGPEARGQLAQLITPEAIGIMAGVLIAWGISHAFGVGEAIDIIVSVVGALSIGLAVFSGLDQLYEFVSSAYHARAESDLDAAADHLAKAITILGIQAVLAFLFRGRPSTERVRLGGATLPRAPGLRYKPTTAYVPLPRGVMGTTAPWGDIQISTLAAAEEREITLLHEGVHRFLVPKLYVLRDFRVENRMGSYITSSLWRYIEEALAETVALVGTKGFSRFFAGVSFPVKNGYVYLLKAGDTEQKLGGTGLLPEGAGLIAGGLAGGIAFKLGLKVGTHTSISVPRR